MSCKPSAALIRQGQATHWYRDDGTVCGSHVGACSFEQAKATCERCLSGERAEDTITGPYGKPYVKPPPYCDESGQLELIP